MIYIRSLLFFIGQVVSVIFFSLLALFLWLLPLKPRIKIMTLWSHFIIWWLKITCNLTHEVIGLENIPDKPCVFASNHQSAWETFALQTFLPMIAFVLKRELLNIPFFGWGLRAISPIAINRQEKRNAMDQVIHQGKEKLAEGRYIAIFPEGTRMPYGQPGRYKLGAVKLARAADVPIIPVSHNGGKFWGIKSDWLRHPGVVRCYIGEAISTEGKTDPEVADEIKQWVESREF